MWSIAAGYAVPTKLNAENKEFAEGIRFHVAVFIHELCFSVSHNLGHSPIQIQMPQSCRCFRRSVLQKLPEFAAHIFIFGLKCYDIQEECSVAFESLF